MATKRSRPGARFAEVRDSKVGAVHATALLGAVAVAHTLLGREGVEASLLSAVRASETGSRATSSDESFLQVAERLTQAARQAVEELLFVSETSRGLWLGAPLVSSAQVLLGAEAGEDGSPLAIPDQLQSLLRFDEATVFERGVDSQQPKQSTVLDPSDSGVSQQSKPKTQGESLDAASSGDASGSDVDLTADSLFSGLDVSLDPTFAQTLAKIEVNTATASELADALNPAFAAPVAFLGGGGGGGGLIATSGGGFSGRVFDGYVANMTVFIDTNANLQLDAGELWTTTGADGSYSFASTAPAGAMIVALGNESTYDISTGASVDMLVAPAGMQYISPLSSAYAYAADDDARAAIMQAAGGGDTLNFDPIAIVEAGSSAPGYAEAAAMVKSGAALLSMAANAATLISQLTGVDASAASSAVFGALAKQNAAGLGNILSGTSATETVSVISAGLDAATGVTNYVDSNASKAQLETLLNDSAAAIKSINAAIDAVDLTSGGSLDDVFANAAIAQNQVKASINEVASLAAQGDFDGAQNKWATVRAEYEGDKLAALAVEAKQFAVLNRDDGAAIVAKADVFRFKLDEGEQSYSPIANDVNRTGADLKLLFVGVRDLSAAAGLATKKDAKTLLLDQELVNTSNRLNDATVLDDLVLFTSDKNEYAIESYAKVTGADGKVSYELTLTSDISDDFESGAFVLAKKPPAGVSLALDDSGTSFSMNYQKPEAADELLSLELFYVVADSSGKAAPDANFIKVYIDPQAPTISLGEGTAIVQESGKSLLVADESISVGKSTELSIPLSMESRDLGTNGTIRLEASYKDWSDVTVSLAVGEDIQSYNARKVSSPSYEGGFAAVWTIKNSDVMLADLSTLKLQVPENFAGDLSPLKIAATRVYGSQKSTSYVDFAGDGGASTTSLYIEVNPKADGLDLESFGQQGLQDLVIPLQEDQAGVLFDDAEKLATQLSNIKLIDGDSEGYALYLEIAPDAGTGLVEARLLEESALVDSNLAYDFALDGNAVTIYAQGSSGSSRLVEALSKLKILPSEDFSGEVSLSYKLGSFESAAFVGNKAPVNWTLDNGTLPVTVVPVSDVPDLPQISLNADFSGAEWIQGDYRGVGVFKVPVYYQLTSKDADENLSISIDGFAIDEIGAVIYQNSQPISIDANDRYNLLPVLGNQGFFEIEVSDEISSWLNLSISARSLDGGLTDQSDLYAQSDNVPLTIAFKATPKPPAIEFLPSALLVFDEDKEIPLTDILTVTPAGGRSLKDVTVAFEIPDSDLNLKVFKDEVDVTSQEIKLADLTDSLGEVNLSRITLRAAANTKGEISGIVVKAKDTVKETGETSDWVASTSGALRINPVADGIDSTQLAASLSDGLTVGLGIAKELSIGNEGSFFSGIAKIDPSEAFSLRLGFFSPLDKPLTSADVSLKVGDRYLAATNTTISDVGGELKAAIYFAINESDLQGGESISLLARNGFSIVEGGYVKVFTNDGSALALKPDIEYFSVQIDADAVAPLLVVNDIVATENEGESDTGIPFEVDISINEERTNFEKIGLRISTDQADELSAGVFKLVDTLGNPLSDVSYDASKGAWVLFKDLNTQIDLSNIFFQTPENYSGDSTFTVTPFARTASMTKDSAEIQLSMQVSASAETVTLASSPPAIKLAEAGATFSHTHNGQALDLTSLVDPATIAELAADKDERLVYEIKVPDTLFVYRFDTGTNQSVALPFELADGTRTYTVDRALSDLLIPAPNGFGQYYVGSEAYAATDSTGGSISVVLKTIEPSSGDSLVTAAHTIGYTTEPVANGLPALSLLKPTVQLLESNPLAPSEIALSQILRLGSLTSADPSETLRLFISDDPGNLDQLALFKKSAGSVDIKSKVSDHGIAELDGKSGWLIDASEFGSIYLRGSDYAATETDLELNAWLVSSERLDGTGWTSGSVAAEHKLSKIISFEVGLKPKADGVTGLVVESNKSLSEYQPGDVGGTSFLSLDQLIIDAARPVDNSEDLFYRVTLSKNQLRLVSDASSTLPKGTVSADGNSITYDVASEDMSKFSIRGVKYLSSADASVGTPQVTISAFTKEVNGTQSAVFSSDPISILLNPVAGAVYSSVPAEVSGLDDAATTGAEGVLLPIRAYTLDASEAIAVEIRFESQDSSAQLVDGDLVFYNSSGVIDTNTAGFSITFDNDNAAIKLRVAASALDSLDALRVSSAKDFRSAQVDGQTVDGRIKVTTIFEVDDGGTVDTSPASTSYVSIYKPVPVVEFNFTGDAIKGVGAADVAFELLKPDGLPAGVELSDITILMSGVPSDAYFVSSSDGGSTYTSFGASFEEIPGLWVFSGADFYQNGNWAPDFMKMVQIRGLSTSDTPMTASASVVDSLGGTSKTQGIDVDGSNQRSVDLSISDPLIFSWNNTDVASDAVIEGAVNFDFDDDGFNEFARYWVPASSPQEQQYSFLVRGTYNPDDEIRFSDLYETFDDLLLDLNLVGANRISGADWGQTKLWSDYDANGQVDSEEIIDLPENFSLSLPAEQVLNGELKGIQPFFESAVSYGEDLIGKIVAVGIPYSENPNNLTASASAIEGFAQTPVLSISPVVPSSSSLSIPEDAAGGPSFMMSLKKSVLTDSSKEGTQTHLVALQVTVKDESGFDVSGDWGLSAGAYKEGYWILSESVLSSPIRVIGLPEHFNGQITITGNAYATVTVGSTPKSVKSGDANVTLAVTPVADTPYIEFASGATDWQADEGGSFYLTDTGQENGEPMFLVSSPDTAEELYIRFVPKDSQGGVITEILVEGEVVGPASDGSFIVAATDLGSVKLTLPGGFKSDFQIEFSAISRQVDSQAESAIAGRLTSQVFVNPIADGFNGDVGDFSLSATKLTEGVSDPVLALDLNPRDSSETILHEMLVRAEVIGVTGYEEVSIDESESLTVWWTEQIGADFDPSQWRLYRAEYADAQAASNASINVEVDQFFDGELLIANAAYTVEAKNGNISAPIGSTTKIVVQPRVNLDDTNTFFADVNEAANIIDYVSLVEGGAAFNFRLYASSLDTDEVVTFPESLTAPTGFVVKKLSVNGEYAEYSITAQTNVNVADPDALRVSATVVYEDGGESLNQTTDLEIRLEKIATKPVLTTTDSQTLEVYDGQRREVIGDATSALGVPIVLPTVDDGSTSDDQLTYVLAGIPKWMTLVSPLGRLVSADTNTYSLEFSQTDLPNIRWKFDRSFSVVSDQAELTWTAVHTELTNFKVEKSDPLSITVTRNPYPTTPTLIGPVEVSEVEGGSTKYALEVYDLNLGGFQNLLGAIDKAVLAGVALTGDQQTLLDAISITLAVSGQAAIDEELSLSYVDDEGEKTQLIQNASPISLSYAELKGASIDYLSGVDFNGSFVVSLSASLTLTDRTVSSAKALTTEISVINEPEVIAATTLHAVDMVVNEGSYLQLIDSDTEPQDGFIALSVANFDSANDDLVTLLALNNGVLLYRFDGISGTLLTVADSIVKDDALYNLYDITALFNATVDDAVDYRIYVPKAATEVKGFLQTKSFDKATGVSKDGNDENSSFSVAVTPVLDPPELVLSNLLQSGSGENYVVLQEDQVNAKKIGVLSFSPDQLEYSTVYLTLSGAFLEGGGRLSVKDSDALWTDKGGGAYELSWIGTRYGPLIPRTAINVEIISGENYFNTQSDLDKLEGDLGDLTDILKVQAFSRFDGTTAETSLGGEALTIKLLVREANDNPLFDELYAEQKEATIWEALESDEAFSKFLSATKTYGYTDADEGDIHRVSLSSGTRTGSWLDGGQNPTVFRNVVKLNSEYLSTISLGANGTYLSNLLQELNLFTFGKSEDPNAENVNMTLDGYEFVPSANYDPNAGYWYVPGMLGVLETVVDDESDKVQWRLLVSKNEFDSLSVDESITQSYQLTLSDFSPVADSDKLGRLFTTVTVTLEGRNDTPEYVGAAIFETGKQSSATVLTNIVAEDGRSDTELLLFFVDPDIRQSQTSYVASWTDQSIRFKSEADISDRIFYNATTIVGSSSFAISDLGIYSVDELALMERVFEVKSILPSANKLISYKTASESLVLSAKVTLTEAIDGAVQSIESDVTFTFDGVVLPDFDLLFAGRDTEAGKHYRDDLFYGSQNDFSQYTSLYQDQTVISVDASTVTSTAADLDGRAIFAVTAAPEDQTTSAYSSNIYGSSGQDVIASAGNGGSLLYGGDSQAHDMVVGSNGNDLFILGGGVDYFAGSQARGYDFDEDIYVITDLLVYAEMEDVGITDILERYYQVTAVTLHQEMQQHLNSLGADKNYFAGILEEVSFSLEGTAIDRLYLDGFDAVSVSSDSFELSSGGLLLTQILTNDTGSTEAYSVLIALHDSTYDYENILYLS